MDHVHAWAKELAEQRKAPAPAAAQVRSVASDLDVALVSQQPVPPQTEVRAVSSEWARVCAAPAAAAPAPASSLSEDVAQALAPGR